MAVYVTRLGLGSRDSVRPINHRRTGWTRRGRVGGIGVLQFRFGGLSNGGKAEKRQRQDRKRLHYIPIEQVRVLNGR